MNRQLASKRRSPLFAALAFAACALLPLASQAGRMNPGFGKEPPPPPKQETKPTKPKGPRLNPSQNDGTLRSGGIFPRLSLD